MLETRGPRLYGERVSALPKGAPHATTSGGQVERSFMWTRTVRGFTGRVGCPNGGLWCLGEEGIRAAFHRSPFFSHREDMISRKEAIFYW